MSAANAIGVICTPNVDTHSFVSEPAKKLDKVLLYGLSANIGYVRDCTSFSHTSNPSVCLNKNLSPQKEAVAALIVVVSKVDVDGVPLSHILHTNFTNCTKKTAVTRFDMHIHIRNCLVYIMNIKITKFRARLKLLLKCQQ